MCHTQGSTATGCRWICNPAKTFDIVFAPAAVAAPHRRPHAKSHSQSGPSRRREPKLQRREGVMMRGEGINDDGIKGRPAFRTALSLPPPRALAPLFSMLVFTDITVVTIDFIQADMK